MAQQPLFTNWLIGQPTAVDPSMLSSSSVFLPTTTSYTVLNTDYLRTINANSAGGALTLTFQSPLPNGFTCWVFVITNNVIISAPSGNVFSHSLGVAATATLTTASNNLALVTVVFDGTNALLSI